MFGMLDYRAHKLFLILFGIPTFLLRWCALIGLTFFSYFVGFENGDSQFTKIILAILAKFLSEAGWALFVICYDRIVRFLFSLIVDVIPADGRSKEEAQLVVEHGDKAVLLVKTHRNPREWTDEEIEELINLDWVASMLYAEKIRARCRYMREYFSEPDVYWDEFVAKRILKEASLNMGIIEAVLTTKGYRLAALMYLFFVYLIVVNPVSL